MAARSAGESGGGAASVKASSGGVERICGVEQERVCAVWHNKGGLLRDGREGGGSVVVAW